MASLHEQRFTEEKPLLRGQDAEMVSPSCLPWSSDSAELGGRAFGSVRVCLELVIRAQNGKLGFRQAWAICSLPSFWILARATCVFQQHGELSSLPGRYASRGKKGGL